MGRMKKRRITSAFNIKSYTREKCFCKSIDKKKLLYYNAIKFAHVRVYAYTVCAHEGGL